MGQVEKLRAARESYAVKLRDFVRIFSNKPDVLVCFFEGEDVKYYGPRLDMLLNGCEWESINCRGKDAVYKLWDLISHHEVFAMAKTAYFFDRDFDQSDERPTAPNVYVTPCYSVENLYVTLSAAKRILRAEFGLNEAPDEDGTFSTCIATFEARLNDYLDAMELVNACILFHRREERREGCTSQLKLRSLKASQMVNVDLSHATRLYSLFDLQTAISNSRPVEEAQLLSIASEFNPGERYGGFRGKFQVHFMRTFFARLADDANSETPSLFPERRHVGFYISERNFLSELSQHADTPNCLKAFIAGLN
jgi:hypothetical protein